MKPKQITAEQFAMETGKFLAQAQDGPVIIRSDGGAALVLRAISQDELADEIVTANPRFRASIRAARRNRAAGKGVEVREML